MDKLAYTSAIENAYYKNFIENKKTVIVLDDDPTGTQTVHDVNVYTKINYETILAGLESSKIHYILTNSRGMGVEETTELHKRFSNLLAKAYKSNPKDFILISRSDSTLRGHYPLETDILRHEIEKDLDITFDGEILCPAYFEGGRITTDNIHYLVEDNILIPVNQTEFAKDKTFSYSNSNLLDWIIEKSDKSSEVLNLAYISIEELESEHAVDNIASRLESIDSFTRIVLNATSYIHLKIFSLAWQKASQNGKRFIFRSASSLPKVLGGVEDKTILSGERLSNKHSHTGALIIIGSHVNKTTQQLEELLKLDTVIPYEFNQHLVLEPGKFVQEQNAATSRIEQLISQGLDVVLFTKRERLDLGNVSGEDELKLSIAISDGLCNVVANLSTRPKYIIAKGGITSSEIAKTALQIKSAAVEGQIMEGVSLWTADQDSKFPGISYIVFPGNVGETETLKDLYLKLK